MNNSWSGPQKNTINLSNGLLYFWPHSAIKDLAKTKKERLDYARFLIRTRSPSEKLNDDFKSDFDWDQVWQAGFQIESWGGVEGLKIWRQPTVGMGFGFAIIRSSYDIRANPENIIASLESISPEVWIKFGYEVKSGEAWKHINQSLKPRQLSLKPEDGNIYRARIKTLAETYLRERVWH